MADTQKGLDLSRRESRPKGRNFLLAIAIDEYVHCSRLNNAVADVSAFISLMERRYHFEADCITFIRNAEATKKRIELELLKLIRVVTPQDNLLIYFSGHGRYDPLFGGNWVPVDAGVSEEDWPDYLSNDLIKGYLNRIPSFHTFLIADSCFSGSLFIDKNREKFTGDRRETEASRWGLTSGKREVVSDGPPGHHSPFAAALLDVLEKAEQPPSVMYICHMVLEKVQANEMQTPMGSPLAVKGHQGGQFVFHFRADENTDWAEMKGDPEGCRQYLALYPEGKYRREAEGLLAKTAELKAWEQAVSAKTVYALLDFEEQFPESPQVVSGEVGRLIADLDEVALWSDATQSNTVSAYREYLRRTTLNKFKAEAEAAIEGFRRPKIENRPPQAPRPFLKSEKPAEKNPETSPSPPLVTADKKQAPKADGKMNQPDGSGFPMRWILAGAFGLAVILFWLFWRPDAGPKLPTEQEAFDTSDSLGTIPAYKNFLDQFPDGAYRHKAAAELNKKEQELSRLLNNADVIIHQLNEPGSACPVLDSALMLDPENAKTKALIAELKKHRIECPDPD